MKEGNRKKYAAAAMSMLLLSAICLTQWMAMEMSRAFHPGAFAGGTEYVQGGLGAGANERRQNGGVTFEKKRPRQRDSSYSDGMGKTRYHRCTTENGKVVTLPVLPQLILAGVMKSGTTAMYDLMKQHPNIRATRRTEAHFFDTEAYGSTRGCEREIKYAGKFVRVKRPGRWRREGNDTVIYFEKTPSYFHIPDVPRRIKTFCARSDPKILIMLRNPIERAVSQFKLTAAAYPNRNKATFDEQVQMSVDRMRECGVLSEDASRRNLTSSPTFDIRNNMPLSEQWERLNQYGGDTIIKGFYDVHLYNWIQEFPLDGGRIKVISYEDFRSDKSKVFDEVLEFIGLPPLPSPVPGTDPSKFTRYEKQLHSLRKKTRTDGENLFVKHFHKFGSESDGSAGIILSEETRERLRRLYDPHVDRLADMLGEEWRNKWW